MWYNDKENDDSSSSSEIQVQENKILDNAELSETILQNSSLKMNNKKAGPVKRLCVFCNCYKSRLTIHIKKMHSKNSRIEKILAMTQKEQIKEFTKIRREGIYQENFIKIKNKEKNLIADKKLRKTTESVLCNNCNFFFSKNYIRRHIKNCHIKEQKGYSGIFSLSSKMDGEFVKEILVHFRSDEIGRMCISDEYLVELGKWMWNKCKHKNDKKKEYRDSVRKDMRQIAMIYKEMINIEKNFCTFPCKFNDIRDVFAK